jgi:hypothetical protein
MLITTAPAPSQRTSPCAISEGDPLFKKSGSEGDPLLKKSAAIELIVSPTMRSATAAGIDRTFTSYKRVTGVQSRVEFVSKLLISGDFVVLSA